MKFEHNQANMVSYGLDRECMAEAAGHVGSLDWLQSKPLRAHLLKCAKS